MKKETKEERFIRIAEKRVQNLLNNFQSLSQLANKKTYSWNNNQLKKIWSAIEKEFNNCKDAFTNPDNNEFKL